MSSRYTNKLRLLLALCMAVFANALYAQSDQAIKKVDDSATYAKELSHSGNRYFETGNFEMAAKTFFASLRIAERKGYASIAATNYNNLSATYFETENYPQAIVYAEKAISSFQNLDDKKGLADAYNSLANVYYMQEQDSLCLHYFLESIANRKLINDSAGLFKGYKNLGAIYFETGDSLKGIAYMLQGIRYISSKSDTESWFTSYITLTGAYLDIGQLPQAQAYLDSCARLLPQVRNVSKIEDYYYIRYRYYAKKGDLKEALASYEKYGAYRDSVINVDKNARLSELNVKYETERKQAKIQQQAFEITKRNNWLLMAGISLVLLGLAIYFFYRQTMFRRAKERQEERFQQQEIAARSLFEGEQQERIRIARDLHDGVGQRLSLVKMNLSAIAETPQLQKAQELLDNTIQELRTVSHNLIPEELHFGMVPALENLADKVNASGTIQMETDIPEQLRNLKWTKEKELSVYRMVQEILNNMVKHAKASLIQLSAREQDHNLVLVIKDNGIGLRQEAIDQSKGIGWKNIQARIRLMDAQLKIHAPANQGTQIELIIPIDGQ